MYSLNKQERKQLRSRIFKHLDGIVSVVTLYHLGKSEVGNQLLSGNSYLVEELSEKYNANAGYLNVALRVCSSQGWVNYDFDQGRPKVQLTPKGSIALLHHSLLEDSVAFIPHSVQMGQYVTKGFSPAASGSINRLFQSQRDGWGFPKPDNETEEEVFDQMKIHLQGLLAGPLIVALGMNGLFHNYFSVAPFKIQEYTERVEELRPILEFFADIGWMEYSGDIFNFSAEGEFFAKRASAYGVTVSYLPMFSLLDELLFGNPGLIWQRPANSPEIHVDRTMNVWGSGGAHGTYFKKVDEIVKEIFNRDISEQPMGFLDMGCGNGAFIEHIFNLIWKETKRGLMLNEYPLFIIGADYNEAALYATRKTLLQADIWAKVVWADISDPKALAVELKDKYKIDLQDLLNVRSFLDHNRIFKSPEGPTPEQSHSTGAFAFRGQLLDNRVVEANLTEHLSGWSEYVGKYGLLLIELHSLPPAVTAANLGTQAVTAYDATHGFSDQYIVEYPCFLKAAERTGLKPVPRFEAVYPSEEMPIISINLLTH